MKRISTILISVLSLTLAACGSGGINSGQRPPTQAEIDIMARCDNLAKQCRFNGDVKPCSIVKQNIEQANQDEIFYLAFCG